MCLGKEDEEFWWKKKKLNRSGLGQRGCELLRYFRCFQQWSSHGKTQRMNWWYAMPLILERTSIWPSDWQQCEDLPTFLCEFERQLTCFDCAFRSFPQNWYDAGRWTVIVDQEEVGDSFIKPRILLFFFLQFFGPICSYFFGSVPWEFHIGLKSVWMIWGC